MKNAFTLIELLVVLVIVAVLAGIGFPVYQHIVENGRAVSCVSNLRQLGVALNLYLGEHNSTMPALLTARADKAQDVPVIDNTLNAYASNPDVFRCPADRKNFWAVTGTSYFWNSALNGQALANLNFLAIADLSHIPILGDKEGFHPYIDNKVNILYADGHASKDVKFFTGP